MCQLEVQANHLAGGAWVTRTVGSLAQMRCPLDTCTALVVDTRGVMKSFAKPAHREVSLLGSGVNFNFLVAATGSP